MAYRRTLKRRAIHGRGTRRYNQTVYRRAYYTRRRGVGRKEKKGADVPFTTETVLSSTNTNGGIYLLNGIQEGVGSWNRIGRYMWNKSIELDLTLRYTSSYGALDTDITSGEWVRAVLVWDKQPNNGAIPTFDTIFGQTSQAGVESASVMDHLRYDNMFRFKVLMDEDLSMQETIELRDPLVKRRLYKSSPEYRKKKERLLKYPETRGIKPKFPGYDPDFYRNKEAREFLEWERRPIHLKKYADQYKSLVESAKDVVEGPQRPPQPLYVWKEGSWDVYSDVPPKGGIAYKRTYVS